MRLEKLRQRMEEQDLAGMLITNAHNRRYLSGFTGSSGMLIISPERQAILSDFRYVEQIAEQAPEWELIQPKRNADDDNLLSWLREMELGGCRVGFELHDLTVGRLLAWERQLKGHVRLEQTSGMVEQLRQQKDTTELEALRHAIALADETMAYIFEWIKPGMTETQVAWEIELYMRTRGASALSFDPIVASGPHSAKPHAEPSERVIQAGEPIVLDFGCIVEGYCSDITRTVCLGQPADEQYLTVWHKVHEAQAAALQGAKAGLTGQEIDAFARDIIAEAGHADDFGHSLGHGVGLYIHEGPSLNSRNDEAVPSGAVVTVEPGIYLPQWGGVRLEDVVLFGEEGIEILTHASKEPIIPLT